MALIFTEGFDKYGGVNNNAGSVAGLLTDEWTAVTANTPTITAPLSATGFALALTANGSLEKTLPANYARLIMGLRVSTNLVGQSVIMQFRDGVTAQCSLCIESSGVINLRSGSQSGTVLSSAGAITVNSIHYFEVDITFSTIGAYQVWMDGVSLFNGTGNTRAGTTNNYSNAIALRGATSTTINYDDLYVFDATGTTNNAPLLNSPRIETTFPISDSAVQFAVGAGVLGPTIARSTTTTGVTTNSLSLRRFVPSVTCTLNSITILHSITNAGVNVRGVVYADSSGVAGALMSSGPTITGITSGVATVLPLTTPQTLTAGTAYWLGLMNDIAISSWPNADNTFSVSRATITFTSGAPSTAPAMTTGLSSVLFWGNLTGVTGNNWYQSAQTPPAGQYGYVYDATVGDEDLYSFAPLTTTPATIHAVAVKGYIAKSDTGTRTVSLRLKSGSTDSGGSLTGQAPGTAFGWKGSHFETDPNGSVPWSIVALNAATAGVKIDA